MSRKIGSFRRVSQLGFAKQGHDVLLAPNTTTTYTADRVIQLPPEDVDSVLLADKATQEIENKTIDGTKNTVTNVSLTTGVTGTLPLANGGSGISTVSGNKLLKTKSDGSQFEELTAITPNRALISDGGGLPIASSVTSTELGYVSGLSSAIQSQIDNKISKDGSIAFTDHQSMGSKNLTNVADPIAIQDAATKGYVDLQIQGVKPKQAVRAVAQTPITLANLQTVDGVSLAAGDRVLVMAQASSPTNGIYIVVDGGAWTRALDFDALSPVDEINGSWVGVQAGSQAGSVFIQYNAVTTLGVDPILFTYMNALSGLLGGDGITVLGSKITADLAATGGLVSTNPGNDAGQIKVDTDDSTIEVSTGNKVRIKALGITDAEISATAGIDATKISQGSVTNTEFDYLAGLTGVIQDQLDGKATKQLDNLDIASLDSEALLVGDGTAAVKALPVGSVGQVLTVLAGPSLGFADPSTKSFKSNWLTADGTTKAITHNLGTNDVIVQIYDLIDMQSIDVDTVTRTSTNVITLTASEAPNASGWRVLIMAV